MNPPLQVAEIIVRTVVKTANPERHSPDAASLAGHLIRCVATVGS
jgi:hypothetical protein